MNANTKNLQLKIYCCSIMTNAFETMLGLGPEHS